MRLYNTLTRQREPFVPAAANTVRMYACGLTVYARGHIGNFRTFLCLDVLRRTLKYLAGFEVRQVVNFTDVDDKTIAGAAARAGVPLREYTERYIAAFREDCAALGLEPSEENPRATDPANIAGHGRHDHGARAKGHTYRSDGSIYFKIATHARLRQAGASRSRRHPGRRARRHRRVREGRRPRLRAVEGHQAGRADLGCAAPARAVRAGTSSARRWRCACSASRRSTSTAGGIDLIFPHHENEIAQSEVRHRP